MVDVLEDLCSLFGERYDSDAVARYLSGQPRHVAEKPSDGSQYIVCNEGGFDLLFRDEDAIAGHRQSRVLNTVFLYNTDADGHRRFEGSLPFGFTFGDTRSALLHKQVPERTWKIGEGRVPVDHPCPSSDRWIWGRFAITASYCQRGVDSFQISPFDPESVKSEWKPPATWQQLALDPARKAEAIKLYREQNDGGVAEAKAAIEAHLAQQALFP